MKYLQKQTNIFIYNFLKQPLGIIIESANDATLLLKTMLYINNINNILENSIYIIYKYIINTLKPKNSIYYTIDILTQYKIKLYAILIYYKLNIKNINSIKVLIIIINNSINNYIIILNTNKKLSDINKKYKQHMQNNYLSWSKEMKNLFYYIEKIN